MNYLVSIWEFFVDNFLTQPAYFIGLMVLVGYLLLKKPVYECIAGFIKATVGYLILTAGSSGLSNTFKPILEALQTKFNLSAVILDTYYGQAAAQSAIEAAGKAFSQVMLLMFIAFMFNILLVRFKKYTKLRAVFTTGHIQQQQATVAFWFIFFCFPQLGDTALLVIMALLLGLYWAVGSNMTVEMAQELTDGAGFCVAHQQMFGIYIWSAIGEKVFGRVKKDGKTKRFEDYNLPGWLSIFNENIVSTSILMTIAFGTILIVLGSDWLLEQGMYSGNFVIYILTTGFTFAEYLAILQLGVRTFVGELTNSFQGIQEKLLPGAVPGLDCAAGYGFGSSNAITFGFICGAVGQFLGIMGLIVFSSPVLCIAGFVPVFFDNATMAIYVNARAGAKAAMLATFINGLVQVLVSALAAWHFGLVEYGGYMAMHDWVVIWPLMSVIMEYLSYVGLGIVVVVLIAIPQLQYRRDPEGYWLVVDDYEAYKVHVGRA